ncbi:MAG: hypothetical protein WA940_13725, partial [Sphingopyxis sp.]
MKISMRAALRGSLCAAALVVGMSAMPAMGQRLKLEGAQIPLSDTDCSEARRTSQFPTVTNGPHPCQVDGTRTVTAISETVTEVAPVYPGAPPRFRVDGTYRVDFDGQLLLDGRPTPIDPTDPHDLFDFSANVLFPDLAKVDLSASYQGRLSHFFSPGLGIQRVDAANIGELFGINGMTSLVRSIDVNLGETEFEDEQNGVLYVASLSTPDPTAISNNSVNFEGRFHGTGSKIIFGKIDGVARLIAAPAGAPSSFVGTESPLLDENGDPVGIYLSPFALSYDITPVISTQLDENGLITPKVEVTDGIEMNGSRITGLTAGVDATDAVNKAQLDAAVTGAINNYVDVSSALAVAQASGVEAIAIGGAAQASGDGGIAIGGESRAIRSGTLAIGSGSFADASHSTAVGYGAGAYGNSSVAVGDLSRANTGSTAMGSLAVASGRAAVAIGVGARAEVDNSMAIGPGARALEHLSTAIGTLARAEAENSTAIGFESVANRTNSVSFGKLGAERQLTNVAAGTQGTDAVNLDQLNAVQTVANNALANAATAQGTADTALANAATAQGAADTALANAATAQDTADAALAAATGAQGAADTALGNAAAAQGTANAALANAAAAQSSANAAQGTADTALTNAATAQASANAAQGTADTALASAAAAQGSADQAIA